MNELNKRVNESVGSYITPSYVEVADGSVVTTLPNMALDITYKETVINTIKEI